MFLGKKSIINYIKKQSISLKIDTNHSILKYLIASNQFKTCSTIYLIYLQFLLFILVLLIKLLSLFSHGNWMYYLVYIRLFTYGKITTKKLIKVVSLSIFHLFASWILLRKTMVFKENLLYKNMCIYKYPGKPDSKILSTMNNFVLRNQECRISGLTTNPRM